MFASWLRNTFTKRAHVRTAPPTNKFTPGLEVFDERLVPASFGFNPATHVATVTGGAGADSIVIQHNGNGGITVTDANGLNVSQTGVDRLVVSTGDGADAVRYRLTGNLARSMVIEMSLGNGNDRFTGTLNNDINPNRKLDLFVNGYNGNDLLTLYGAPTAPNRANDFLTDGLAINAGGLRIGSGGELEVDLKGNLGNDRVLVDYQGELDGVLDMNVDGGSDQDVLSGIVRMQAGSTGRVGTTEEASRVAGYYGSDNLTFLIFDE